jgi:hypothetical protein
VLESDCRVFLAGCMISFSVVLSSGSMRLSGVFVMFGSFVMSVFGHCC